MLLMYVDETGDAGFESPCPVFGLAGLFLDEENWLSSLDRLVNMRRLMRTQFSVRMQAEIKAYWLINGKKGVAHLSRKKRRAVYRMHMDVLRTLPVSVFSVLIQKDLIQDQAGQDPRDKAWTYFIQRMERETDNQGKRMMLFPDDGHEEFIRRKLREMRRYSRVPSAKALGPHAPFQRDAVMLIEDPNHRSSEHSYFIQMADLCAYAMYRHVRPIQQFGSTMWERLGGVRNERVNMVGGGPKGIVVWPKK